LQLLLSARPVPDQGVDQERGAAAHYAQGAMPP
jgi:hypothetical protein